MIRAWLVGLAAVGGIVAVIAVVFAVGIARLAFVESRTPEPSVPTTPPTTQVFAPDMKPVTTAPHAQDPPEPDPATDGNSIELVAEQATLSPRLKLSEGKYPVGKAKHKPDPRQPGRHPDPPPGPVTYHFIAGWQKPDDSAEWTLNIPKPGRFEIDVVCSFAGHGGNRSAEYTIAVADQELTGTITGNKHNPQSYEMSTTGTVPLPAGQTKLRFHLNNDPVKGALNLKSVRIVPAS